MYIKVGQTLTIKLVFWGCRFSFYTLLVYLLKSSLMWIERHGLFVKDDLVSIAWSAVGFLKVTLTESRGWTRGTG